MMRAPIGAATAAPYRRHRRRCCRSTVVAAVAAVVLLLLAACCRDPVSASWGVSGTTSNKSTSDLQEGLPGHPGAVSHGELQSLCEDARAIITASADADADAGADKRGWQAQSDRDSATPLGSSSFVAGFQLFLQNHCQGSNSLPTEPIAGPQPRTEHARAAVKEQPSRYRPSHRFPPHTRYRHRPTHLGRPFLDDLFETTVSTNLRSAAPSRILNGQRSSGSSPMHDDQGHDEGLADASRVYARHRRNERDDRDGEDDPFGPDAEQTNPFLRALDEADEEFEFDRDAFDELFRVTFSQIPLTCRLSSAPSYCSVSPGFPHSRALKITVDTIDVPSVAALEAIVSVVQNAEPPIAHIYFDLLTLGIWDSVVGAIISHNSSVWANVDTLTFTGVDRIRRDGNGTFSPAFFAPFAEGLEILNIHVNNLQLEAANFASAPNLRKLNLSSSSAVALPSPRDIPVFDGLSKLSELDLSFNNLSRLQEDTFLQVPTVESLTLHGNILLDVPEGVFDPMANLTMLSISSNQLRSLPERLFSGKAYTRSLRNLDLSSNFLHALPPLLFRDTTALEELRLGNNALTALGDPRLFEKLTGLRRLDLPANRLTSVHAALLSHLTRLRRIDFASNRLTAIPNGFFNALESMEELRMFGNLITSIPTDSFSRMGSLRRVFFNFNNLTRIPRELFARNGNISSFVFHENKITEIEAGALDALTNAERIHLDANQITALPEGVFDSLLNARQLFMMSNPITQFPKQLFKNMGRLEWLFIYRLRLSELDEDVFAGLTNLSELYVNHNLITTLPTNVFAPLENLEVLFAQYNLFSDFPSHLIANNPLLIWLNLNGNRLQRLSEDLLLNSQKIRVFYARDNPLVLDWRMFRGQAALERVHVDGIAEMKVDDYRADEDPDAFAHPHFISLGILNTPLSGNIPGFLQTLEEGNIRGVRQLSFGWPGLNESIVPFHRWCKLLAPLDRVLLFGVFMTNYRQIDLCFDQTRVITSGFVVANHMLETIRIGTIGGLDLNSNSMLTTVIADAIPVIDISFTRVPFSDQICDTWGTEMLFANALAHPSYEDSDNAFNLMKRCLLVSKLIDFSQNAFLSNLQLVSAASSGVVFIGDPEFYRNQVILSSGEVPVSRREIPLLILDGTPVTCGVSIRLLELLSGLNGVAYRFVCTCSPGHTLLRGECVVDKLTAGEVTAITLGVLLFVMVIVTVVVRRMLQKRARERARLSNENELKQRLLEEQEGEVEALKHAWEISFTELALIEKVDEGAFGEVWKAEWDTVLVAVKFMKQEFAVTLDTETMSEFSKELDFLRRTRHPNLVRFFGTGSDPHNAPFIVLEFVANGSLFALITKTGLDVALERYCSQSDGMQTTRASASLHAPHSAQQVSPRKANLLASTLRGGLGSLMDDVATLEGLKLRLARDIACGMSFIHEQKILHRDLKSGNVLVSQRLVAKLTDFGSMRECLEGHRDGPLLTSTAGEDLVPESRDTDALLSVENQAFNPLMTMFGGINADGFMFTAGVGTPLYMAPEMLEMSNSYTSKADVFSFGIVLWELWTCRHPDLVGQEVGDTFKGPFLMQLQSLLLQGKRLAFTSEDPPVAGWYKDLYERCVAPEPSQRPSFQVLYDSLSRGFAELKGEQQQQQHTAREGYGKVQGKVQGKAPLGVMNECNAEEASWLMDQSEL